MTVLDETARLWIKVTLPGGGQLGPGKIALLHAVERERSIAAAARGLGMSYRRAWTLVRELNGSLAMPVVETHVGGSGRGGARLTSVGRDLIARFENLVAQANAAAAADLEALAVIARRGAEKD